MALGVMVVGVRASLGMTGSSDGVWKGGSMDDSGSWEADTDR